MGQIAGSIGQLLVGLRLGRDSFSKPEQFGHWDVADFALDDLSASQRVITRMEHTRPSPTPKRAQVEPSRLKKDRALAAVMTPTEIARNPKEGTIHGCVTNTQKSMQGTVQSTPRTNN